MNRADVLIAAKEAVESRGKAYAPPESNFARIAAVHVRLVQLPAVPRHDW